MIIMSRTNSENKDFIELVNALDAELAKRDGQDHEYYAQFNQLDTIKHVLVVYENNEPVGCGAIKEFSPKALEIKRMYVLPQNRGKGHGKLILSELEIWSLDLKYKKCVLETGKRQPEAIALYKKMGYEIVANYGQYKGVENSLCFEKRL